MNQGVQILKRRYHVMERVVLIKIGELELKATLNESATANLIWQALPIKAKANTWGDEIYFEIPVTAELEEDAREVVDKGDLGYWPTGNALCIFFGPTPVSHGDEIRPASPVNVVGKVEGNLAGLKAVKDGDRIELSKLAE
jgi:hypothetical protein